MTNVFFDSVDDYNDLEIHFKALDGMENPAFIQKMNDLRNEDSARKRAEIMRELMKLNPIWAQCEENIEAALQADQKNNIIEDRKSVV